MKKTAAFLVLILLAGALSACQSESGSASSDGKTVQLLNVSYDPTRELYKEYNQAFSSYWKKKTGQDVTVQQSHGGSGKQARSVIDGLDADVVTLALGYDIDSIAEKARLIDQNWQSRLPDQSTPYTSTIVFLVRKGNPKHITDWADLVKKDVSVITPNPKTSGGARWNYLAAWAYADETYHHDDTKIKQFMKDLYGNVEVLDSGARGATTSFTERGMGDVLIAWENEAYLTLKEFGKEKYEIVNPSISILAEPPVSVVDKTADKKGTKKAAEAYLSYLYSKKGQEIAAKNFYRPRDKEVLKTYEKQFPKIKTVTVEKEFGGWKKAQVTHFNDGGTFDSIYEK